MPTINSTLSLAKRALLAHQGAMGTSADNVANVNTPGYARKSVDLRPSPGLHTMLGAFGGGVDLLGVRGERDRFIDRQVRAAMGEAGRYQTGQQQLQMVEEILGEINDAGLSNALDQFWNGWHDLANDPGSMSSRYALRESAARLVNIFNNMDRRLNQRIDDINDEITVKVSEINSITRELASLNRDLAVADGNAPELIDRRSLLLDQLAILADTDYRVADNGVVSVFLDGASLVMDDKVQILGTEPVGDGAVRLVITDAAPRGIEVRGGEIGALFDVRVGEIAELHGRLDRLATTLAGGINAVHTNGYGLNGSTGVQFFDPETTGIGDIALDRRIEEDAARIAASTDGNPGDNRLALTIAELEHNAVLNDGTETIGQALSSINSWFGATVAQAGIMAEGADAALDQSVIWRESVSGVSLDEEMAQLIQYQLAFNASAKLVGMVDTMLEQILAMVG